MKLSSEKTEYYSRKGGLFTAEEILQQPQTWLKTAALIGERKAQINAFLDEAFAEECDVVLTGAGTSEFVGNSAFPFLNRLLDQKVRSAGSTDIVPCPQSYIDPKVNTLLVSFARSGNSPESIGAVDCANAVSDKVYHLIITCNKDGQLSKAGQNDEHYCTILLPEETNDRGFAMTSSFSCMLLACVCCFMQYKGLDYEPTVKMLADKAESFLTAKASYLHDIVKEYDYGRIIYLGSECLKGISQESALKTCELTAGTVMTTYDSTMGFRHGPKSVVKDNSLVVVYVSDDPYTRQYDLDIVKEIHEEGIGKIMTVSGTTVNEGSDYAICFENDQAVDNVFLGLEFIMVGQILALMKSLAVNNTPDDPCSTGQVSRVVHGVKIYSYKQK